MILKNQPPPPPLSLPVFPDWILTAVLCIMLTLLIAGVLHLLIKLFILGLREEVRAYVVSSSDTETRLLPNLLIELLESVHPGLLMAIGLDVASALMPMPYHWGQIIHSIPLLILLLQVGYWGHLLIKRGVHFYVNSRSTESDRLTAETIQGPVQVMGALLIWSVIILVALSNLGINVTALLTGLGIGGVAVALAVQNILSDLFATLSIILDKPFVVGDPIELDQFVGSIQKIGVKSTRIQSIHGESIIISNADLLKSRLRNYATLKERRMHLKFYLHLKTLTSGVSDLIEFIESHIKSRSLLRYERVSVVEISPQGIAIECVYWVLSSDFTEAKTSQHQLNMAVLAFTEKHEIHLANQVAI